MEQEETRRNLDRFDVKAKLVLTLVLEQPGVTAPEIQRITGFPNNTVRYNLLLLSSHRLIKRRPKKNSHQPGPARWAYYPEEAVE